MTTSATRIHPRSPFSLIQIGQVQIVYRLTAKPAIAHAFYRRPSSKQRFKFMAAPAHGFAKLSGTFCLQLSSARTYLRLLELPLDKLLDPRSCCYNENRNEPPREASTMLGMRDAIGVLLAGGQGERLWPLTRDRAKPAVPFGALYRIIDITLSNCINSALRRVFVLTQYKALSLNRHIRAGWSPIVGLGEYIEVLTPQMRVSKEWYQGTADAVYQNIYSIGSERSKYVFILSGDHIYKMDYSRMLQQHLDSGADVTVGTIQISTKEAAKQFGVIEVDKDWRIVGFEEKPAHPKESPHNAGHCNASMGIYIFNTQLMIPI